MVVLVVESLSQELARASRKEELDLQVPDGEPSPCVKEDVECAPCFQIDILA